MKDERAIKHVGTGDKCVLCEKGVRSDQEYMCPNAFCTLNGLCYNCLMTHICFTGYEKYDPEYWAVG